MMNIKHTIYGLILQTSLCLAAGEAVHLPLDKNYPPLKINDKIIQLDEINKNLQKYATDLRPMNNFCGNNNDTNNIACGAIIVLYENESNIKYKTFYIKPESESDLSTLDSLILFESSPQTNTLKKYTDDKSNKHECYYKYEKGGKTYYAQNDFVTELPYNKLYYHWSNILEDFLSKDRKKEINAIIKLSKKASKKIEEMRRDLEYHIAKRHEKISDIEITAYEIALDYLQLTNPLKGFTSKNSEFCASNVTSCSETLDNLKNEIDNHKLRVFNSPNQIKNNQIGKLTYNKNTKDIFDELQKNFLKNQEKFQTLDGLCETFKGMFFDSEQRLLMHLSDIDLKTQINEVSGEPVGFFMHVYSTLTPCNRCLYALSEGSKNFFTNNASLKDLQFLGTLCTYDIPYDTKCIPQCRPEKYDHKQDEGCKTINTKKLTDVTEIPWCNKDYESTDDLLEQLLNEDGNVNTTFYAQNHNASDKLTFACAYTKHGNHKAFMDHRQQNP
jgi:hypothetical protein